MSKKPLGSSTPNYCPRVTRRRGVHSYQEDDDFSPVVVNNGRSGTASPQTRSPAARRRNFQASSESENTDDDSEEEQHSGSLQNFNRSRSLSKNKVGEAASISKNDSGRLKENRQQQEKETSILMENKGTIIGLILLVLAIVVLAVSSSTDVPQEKTITLEDVKSEFPTQDDDFWLAVDSGLKEVDKFNKPSVFLLLYKEDAEKTLDGILRKLSHYATCLLENCKAEPIVFTSEELLANEALKTDLGHLLIAHKTDLEERHVMIVKNLEKLPGYVVRVLHSFCDEFSPAVRRSVFFFTVKVANLPRKELKYVKSVLRKQWSDIGEDQFEPLFARISGMILSVKS